MSPRTIIVTGAAGFLGSHTVEALLRQGHAVRGLDLPQARWQDYLGTVLGHPALTSDRRDLLDVPADDPVFAGADAVIHCAGLADHAPSMTDPELYMRVNVLGTVRILEAARAHAIGRVVNLSSAAVYGIASAPTAESHPINPLNPYALTKWMGEEACEAWSRLYGVSTVSFRVFNCYGPRAQTGGILVALMGRRRAGLPLMLTGTGDQQRDFVFATDAAEALALGALTPGAAGAYNLGSGRPETIRRVAELMGGPIEYGPARTNELPIILADISRARRDLGWEPTTGLEDGIARLLAGG